MALMCSPFLAGAAASFAFFFKYEGEDKFGIKSGDILVVDRSQDPELDDLIINKTTTKLQISKYSNQEEIWGTITWTLSQIKK